MKKPFIQLCLILLITLMSGCYHNTTGQDIEEPPDIADEIGNSEEPETNDDTESDVVEDIPTYEYSAEEKSLLMIDNNKIILGLFDVEKGKSDDLGLLLIRYPDAVLISREYFDIDRFGEDVRNEVWYSDTVGLYYWVEHFISRGEIYGKSNIPMNWVRKIWGEASGLVSGLIAPIKIGELMELLDVPEHAWEERKWPEAPGFENYFGNLYHDGYIPVEIPDRVYIVIADPNDEIKPIIIEIETSKPGYISPEDEVTLTPVTSSN